MFRFADLGYQWVPVDLPQDEGSVRVHLLMHLLTREELRARERDIAQRTGAGLVARAAQVESLDDYLALFDETTVAEAGDVAELAARTTDWRGFGDRDGEAVEFSRERLAAVLAYDLAFKPIRQAWFRASREGVAKNSEPGPGGSPAPAQA